MLRLLRYYGYYQGFRSSLGQMPAWARAVVGIFALPGIVLISLSILALCVSVLALLLLSVPVYQVLRMVSGVHGAAWTDQAPPNPGMQMDIPVQGTEPVNQGVPPRRHVDVKIVE